MMHESDPDFCASCDQAQAEIARVLRLMAAMCDRTASHVDGLNAVPLGADDPDRAAALVYRRATATVQATTKFTIYLAAALSELRDRQNQFMEAARHGRNSG